MKKKYKVFYINGALEWDSFITEKKYKIGDSLGIYDKARNVIEITKNENEGK